MIKNLYVRDKFESSMCRPLRLYNKAELNDIVNDFSSIFGDFVDYSDSISSLKYYPFQVPVASNYNVMKTPKGVSNVIAARIADSRVYDICLYKIEKRFNSFLDYNGFTHMKLYLPFLGIIDLDVNSIMDNYLSVFLAVDFITGSGTYFVGYYTENDFIGGEANYENFKLLSTFECNIGIDIPLGSTNFGDIVRNVALGTIKTAAMVGASIYTAGLAPAVTTSVTTSTLGAMSTETRRRNPATNRLILSSRTTQQERVDTSITNTSTEKPYNVSEPISETINSSINILNKNYPSIPNDRTNDSCNMAVLTLNPVLYIYYPNIKYRPEYYKENYGLPCGKKDYLSNFHGFAKISSVFVENIDATNTEIEMIKECLYTGVILP